ncbi:MAG: hypothetical protein HY717_14270 [Planctomycetes bacterium]|nr:hypothetical protein [Planctomycetota bacterium]
MASDHGKKWIINHFQSVAPDIHPWLRLFPPSIDFSFRDSDKVNEYLSVADNKLSLAKKMLSGTEIIELSDGMLEQLGVKIESIPERRRLFLVRALFMNDKVGYGIWHEDDRLLIDHSVIGSIAQQIKEAALVIPLVSLPREVFVQCAMDY